MSSLLIAQSRFAGRAIQLAGLYEVLLVHSTVCIPLEEDIQQITRKARKQRRPEPELSVTFLQISSLNSNTFRPFMPVGAKVYEHVGRTWKNHATVAAAYRCEGKMSISEK